MTQNVWVSGGSLGINCITAPQYPGFVVEVPAEDGVETLLVIAWEAHQEEGHCTYTYLEPIVLWPAGNSLGGTTTSLSEYLSTNVQKAIPVEECKVRERVEVINPDGTRGLK